MGKLLRGLGRGVLWLLKAIAFVLAWGAFGHGATDVANLFGRPVLDNLQHTLPDWAAFSIAAVVWIAAVSFVFAGIGPFLRFFGLDNPPRL